MPPRPRPVVLARAQPRSVAPALCPEDFALENVGENRAPGTRKYISPWIPWLCQSWKPGFQDFAKNSKPPNGAATEAV